MKIQTLQNIEKTAESGLQNLRRTSTMRGLKEEGQGDGQAKPRQSGERMSAGAKEP